MRIIICKMNVFTVIKKGIRYYGIEHNGHELTSANTISKACRRAKLLSKVYELGIKENADW